METIAARRIRLANPDGHDNPGLVAQRWLKQHDDGKESARELIAAVAGGALPEPYVLAFGRWRRYALSAPHTLVFQLRVRGPLALGLGEGSPLENGLTLMQPYGVPCLPGSAIKGMCRRGAQRLVESGGMDQKQFLALFGSTEDDAAEGLATFHTAWLEPESVRPFQLDTITVHHSDYYSQSGGAAPSDSDEPVPVPLLTVRPDVSFLVAIALHPVAWEQGWPQFISGMLTWSADHLGLGGKTNAGYGKATVKQVSEPARKSAGAAPAATTSLEWLDSGLSRVRDAPSISHLLPLLDSLARLPDAQRSAGAQRVKAHLESKKLWTPKNADKKWYRRIEEWLNP